MSSSAPTGRTVPLGKTIRLGKSLSPARPELQLAAPGIDATYDAARGDLWLLVLGASKPVMSLVDFAPGRGVVSTTALPPAFQVSVIDRIRIASDGSIWVNAGYAVVRLDPRSGKLTTRTFSVTVPGSVHLFDYGTWIAAIGVESGGRMLVSRNNVPYLTELDAALKPGRHIPVEASFKDPEDLLVTARGLQALTRDGTLSAPSAAAAPYLTPASVPPGAAQELLRETDPGPAGLVHLVSAAGGLIMDTEIAHVGNIVWRASSGSPMSTADLPWTTVIPFGAPPRATPHPVRSYPSIRAATLDAAGALWFTADWDRGSVLYRLAAP